MSDWLSDALRESIELEKQEKEYWDKVQKASEEWKAKWPNHCKDCGGWGYSIIRQTHEPGMTEEIADACDSDVEKLCHRCGEHGLNDDGDGPCKFCGWNFDDGIPG